jgi:hypothetical protein
MRLRNAGLYAESAFALNPAPYRPVTCQAGLGELAQGFRQFFQLIHSIGVLAIGERADSLGGGVKALTVRHFLHIYWYIF